MWISLAVLLVVFVYIGIPLMHSILGRLMLRRKAVESGAMVLTFDDGPGNKLTPALLSILAENKAKATFFLLGRNIPGREAIVRQISQQGHDICSHGYDHLHSWKVSPFRALADIKRGWTAIDTALGIGRSRYPFRPPKGKMNIFCLLYLMLLRVPIVYWSVDSGDTWPIVPKSDRLSLLMKKTGGMVSLTHDFDRSDDSRRQFVLESTRLALAAAKEKNMSVLTVSELFK